MKKLNLLLLLTLGIHSGMTAQEPADYGSPLKIGKNFRIHPSQVTQSEVFLVKSPVEKDILFATCNTISFIPSFFISEGIYTSTDGGRNWTGSDTCRGEPIDFHGGDPGITIDKNGTFLLTRMGRSPFVGLYSHYSLDHGQTWSGQKVISTDDLERAALTTDLHASSPYYGRSYAAWVKFAGMFPVMFSYTDNGGMSWSAPGQVNNPSKRSAGGDLAIGPNGEVYAVWAGQLDVSPFNEILVGFASSADGGSTWNVNENAFPVNGITGVMTSKNNIRVNGLPCIAVDTTNGPRKGWIYIITCQKDLLPAGSDPDIILYRSTDGGHTFSTGIRVNQDPLNNGKTQFFPNVHVDKFGAVDIIFYDDRNTTSDSAGVFLARSTDGGDTWKEYGISDHNFEPEPIGGLSQGYQGDIIDITSTDSTIWTVWMDNSSGIYQIWCAPIAFADVNGLEEETRAAAGLRQNYPNPFTSATKIGFTITRSGMASLTVFDMLGHEVAELVHENKSPGFYSVDFDPRKIPGNPSMRSGVYFYRLALDDKVETKRMTYLK